MHKSVIKAAIAVGLFAVSGLASAATATGNFTVTASVAAICQITAVTNLAFGAYDSSSGTALDAQSTFGVRCTNTTPFTIELNGGSTTGGTVASRLMTSGGGNNLQYDLYTTTGRTTKWGDGTLSTQTVAGTGTGLLTILTQTVYGRIPSGQTVTPAAAFTDTVAITVTF